MKIVFLDIDGVLNSQESKSRCGWLLGIDGKKVKLLRKIIDETNSKIVLCSSWKSEWERNKIEQSEMGNYLDRKLKRENLFILDKTTDKEANRGEGIINWLVDKAVEKWIVIDDEIFDDYGQFGIMDHLVKTTFYGIDGGLQEEHVTKAIELLKEM